MPGQLLHRFARRLCPRETGQIFEPLIADLQREWSDAKPGLARGLRLARAYTSFWSSITVCAARTIALGAVAPIDRDMIGSALRAFGFALLGVTVLRIVGRTSWHETPMAFALAEAQAWSWASVFAMLPVFMYARREPDRRWNATTTRLLIGTLLIAIVSVGWLGPALLGTIYGRTIHAGWRHALNRQLAMIAAALLLALIGWQLSAIRRPSIGRVAFWWFALMEFVLFSGRYAINQAEWQQWRASGILVLILLALRLFRPTLPAPPALPGPPAPVSS